MMHQPKLYTVTDLSQYKKTKKTTKNKKTKNWPIENVTQFTLYIVSLKRVSKNIIAIHIA